MSQELEGTLVNSENLVGTFGSEGGGGTSNYNDLINKPSINSVTLQGNKTASQLGFADVATSGNYNDLNNKPTIPAAQVNSDWNATSGVAEILNKPTLATVATSGNYNDLINKPTIPAAQVNSDWNASSGVAEILNKPTLATVATSGNYNDLTNKPTIPAAQVNSDWNATSGVAKILNKPTIPEYATDLPISSSDLTTDTKTYIDSGLSGKATNDNYVVVKQTQVSLPSAISLTANTISTILNAVDITGLTYSALDNITTMGTDYDLVGAVFLWTNGGNSMQVSMLVDTGNKVTLQVYALANQNISAVRLLTWWKRK